MVEDVVVRVAMVVPVSPEPGTTEEAVLDRHAVTVEHARALARAGAEVEVVLAGPWRHEVALGDGVVARFHPARGRRMDPLVRAAARRRPDVLHLFHLRETSALLAAAILRRGPGPRVVAEYNGGQPWTRPWLRRLVHTATARLDALVFTAAEIAGPFYESGAFSARPELAELPQVSSRLFYSADRSRARERLGFAGDPLVTIVGRQEAPKDPHTALDAFLRIAEQRADARLFWASWGGDEAPAIARRIDGDPRIHVEHIEDRYRMADLHAASDVMIHASRREICGIAFMEAMQAGCPIAASDIPAFRRNGVPGAVRLCPVGDARAFCDGALALAGEPDARAIARRHFVDELSFDAIARRRRDLYERLLSGRWIPARPDSASRADGS